MIQGPGFILAIGLALLHAFVSKRNIVAFIPEHRWLSLGGGISLGFVFLKVFPDLSQIQETVEHAETPLINLLQNHTYLLALVGFLVFYGLDVFALNSRRLNMTIKNVDRAGSVIFWLHIGTFAILNSILSYLLQDLGSHNIFECILFFFAIALNFFIIDRRLREHHKTPYDNYGRWLLTVAIMVGAIAGQVIHLDALTISLIWSFLAGSIILNVLTRELPGKSCFLSFLSGMLLYTVLILVV